MAKTTCTVRTCTVPIREAQRKREYYNAVTHAGLWSMAKLIRLEDATSRRSAFHTVAVLVGVDGPRRIQSANGSTPILTTLSLRDDTVHTDVELTLWETDSVRATSLRMLDVVMIRNAIVKLPDVMHPSTSGHTHPVRLSLSGALASVRLIPDTTANECGIADDISRAAVTAMRWRDKRFPLLVAMRQRGAIWTRDEARHSDRPVAPSARNGPTGTSRGAFQRHVDGHDGEQAGGAHLVTAPPTLADVSRGLVAGCAEVGNVSILNVYVRADGIRRLVKPTMQQVLRDGCWRGCMTCDSRSSHNEDDKNCLKCGGDLKWRFGQFVFKVRDSSATLCAYMAEQDVPSLLFAIGAEDVRKDEDSARWVAAVLMALVNDSGCFTVLIAKEAHGSRGEIRLRRFLV